MNKYLIKFNQSNAMVSGPSEACWVKQPVVCGMRSDNERLYEHDVARPGHYSTVVRQLIKVRSTDGSKAGGRKHQRKTKRTKNPEV